MELTTFAGTDNHVLPGIKILTQAPPSLQLPLHMAKKISLSFLQLILPIGLWDSTRSNKSQ
jgi:hypothetical protein